MHVHAIGRGRTTAGRVAGMKACHDTEVLEAGWLRNPCRNTETTKGVGAHRDELLAGQRPIGRPRNKPERPR